MAEETTTPRANVGIQMAPEEKWTETGRNPKLVDLMDLDMFADREPLEEFRELRRRYPIYWNVESDPEDGFWAITKVEDIKYISTNPQLFSSAKGINIRYDESVDPAIVNAVIGNMITMDPPMHIAFRRVANPFFTFGSIQKLEARVKELAKQIVDDIAGKGEIEFMSECAARLPILVLCDILGVPHSDHDLIFNWSNKLIGLEDPDLAPPTQEEALATFMSLFAYGKKMVDERRKNPKDDLMTAIATAEYEGKPIPETLLNGFFLLMVIAGNETTRNTITGGMKALIEHPDQRDKLIKNPELMPKATEEILRWVSAVAYMRRTATQDTEIRDVKISKGEKLVMWYGAANRDEDHFENPDVFDVARDPNDHVAFGYGQHRCLGARLAQLQIRAMFNELLTRIPDMEFNGPVKRLRSNFINGIKHMPVKYTPTK